MFMKKHENSRLLAMKLSVALGYELARAAPELALGYVSGHTQAALAEDLRRKKTYQQYGQTVMEHAVRFSLVGNDDSKLGPVYEGSISPEVYDIHSKRHRTDARTSNGLLGVIERRGVHGLGHDKLRSNAIKAALARGETPWRRDELSMILSLGLREMFKLNGHIDYGAIADTINDKVYGGQKVRTRVSAREALRRLQRSFDKK